MSTFNISLFIPPTYEIYMGYIVCIFSITMFVCVFVCEETFFSIKDVLETTGPRILKFGTNIGYDLLYCERDNQICL